MPEPLNYGKTMHMVFELPATGSIVVVHGAVMRDYVRRMIVDCRGHWVDEVTRIIVVRDHKDLIHLQGNRLPIFVDHAYWHEPRWDVANRLMEHIHFTEKMYGPKHFEYRV